MKIIICDKTEKEYIEQMRAAGLTVDVRDDITPEQLMVELPNYDGMVVRSRTKVRKDLIDVCPNLKVIVRGGAGLDTIDHEYAKEKGIPVYNSDFEAKKLMNENEDLIQQLIELFGDETYKNGEYNRSYVASKVFNDKELLNQLNAIVHPAVFKHFDEWLDNQNSSFVVKEAAILFESGSYKDCDYIISALS